MKTKYRDAKIVHFLEVGIYYFHIYGVVYCAEITFQSDELLTLHLQSVPVILKENTDLLSKLFKKCKLIVLITSIIHENAILWVSLNKVVHAFLGNCSVSFFFFYREQEYNSGYSFLDR